MISFFKNSSKQKSDIPYEEKKNTESSIQLVDQKEVNLNYRLNAYRRANFCFLPNNRCAAISEDSLQIIDLNIQSVKKFHLRDYVHDDGSKEKGYLCGVDVLDDENLIIAVAEFNIGIHQNKLFKFNLNAEKFTLFSILPYAERAVNQWPGHVWSRIDYIQMLPNNLLAISFTDQLGIWDFNTDKFKLCGWINGDNVGSFNHMALSLDQESLIVLYSDLDERGYTKRDSFSVAIFNLKTFSFEPSSKLQNLNVAHFHPQIVALPQNRIAITAFTSNASIYFYNFITGEVQQIDTGINQFSVGDFTLVTDNILAISVKVSSPYQANEIWFFDSKTLAKMGKLIVADGHHALINPIDAIRFNKTNSHLIVIKDTQLMDCEIFCWELFPEKADEFLQILGHTKKHVKEYLSYLKPDFESKTEGRNQENNHLKSDILSSLPINRMS